MTINFVSKIHFCDLPGYGPCDFETLMMGSHEDSRSWSLYRSSRDQCIDASMINVNRGNRQSIFHWALHWYFHLSNLKFETRNPSETHSAQVLGECYAGGGRMVMNGGWWPYSFRAMKAYSWSTGSPYTPPNTDILILDGWMDSHRSVSLWWSAPKSKSQSPNYEDLISFIIPFLLQSIDSEFEFRVPGSDPLPVTSFIKILPPHLHQTNHISILIDSKKEWEKGKETVDQERPPRKQKKSKW